MQGRKPPIRVAGARQKVRIKGQRPGIRLKGDWEGRSDWKALHSPREFGDVGDFALCPPKKFFLVP
jgi:hypothetical protein